MENIKKALEIPLKEVGVRIDSVTYKNHELRIILDNEEEKPMNIDDIVKATKIISPILDKSDFIKEKYLLDVSSKEKGGN